MDALSDRVIRMAGPPEHMVLGLERMRAAMQELGIPERLPMPVIMVGGTNGKGSTVACLEIFYRQAGYRVAAYTSPHIWAFNERLRLDGLPAPARAWADALDAIATLAGSIALTYFEITTLAAVKILCAAQVDLAILEVGLGGRLDAVNAFTPDCSIITTVDLDHQVWLGTDRLSIGREKAGIFRPDVPALYGDGENPCATVLESAAHKQVPLYILGRDFDFDVQTRRWQGFGQELPMPVPLWAVAAQWHNLALALAAVRVLQKKLPVPDAALSHWQLRAVLPGRAQELRPWGPNTPRLIVDVAHNPQAVEQLAGLLAGQKGRCHAIVAMLADKDIPGTLKNLLERVEVWHVLEITDTPRAARAAHLADCLRELGAERVEFGTNLQGVVQTLLSQLSADDMILCFGSFHLVNQLPRHWLEESSP
ncbi:bifunctional folylpolyglutamate synthase/dihydrofolate synthase [Acidithiobacillus sp. M4-SHS-6]|uniref:bifunctional folylpolyglutamate synthase/dihydrofolate synthase n=1 Tax=Acidithiobacillus sp. M4-SHS-6 TaxID=3383024 RepID=UPI0039BDD3B8